MEEKKNIKCFIASPGDTAEERDRCEKVFSEINRGIGVAYNFELQSLRWENDVHPGIGVDGQDVINRQKGICCCNIICALPVACSLCDMVIDLLSPRTLR